MVVGIRWGGRVGVTFSPKEAILLMGHKQNNCIKTNLMMLVFFEAKHHTDLIKTYPQTEVVHRYGF